MADRKGRRRKHMTIERREVRVKPHDYQPTKAELNEPFVVRKADGTMPTPEEFAQIALAPARIVEDQNA